jgi:hypothetical protein
MAPGAAAAASAVAAAAVIDRLALIQSSVEHPGALGYPRNLGSTAVQPMRSALRCAYNEDTHQRTN